MTGIFKLTYNLDGKVHSVEVSEAQCMIGRSEDCTVSIVAASVSRIHAMITRNDEGWAINDQNSRNGVYVNREKVEEARLHDNDKISLGMVDLIFNIVEQPEQMSVEYSDEIQAPDISQSIDIRHFREKLQSSEQVLEQLDASQPIDQIKQRPADDEENWAIPLFSRAAEALISAVSLDNMFETVVELVFQSLPAERGCIFQYDEESGEKILKVMRQKSTHKDLKFEISNTVITQALSKKSAVLVVDSLRDQAFSSQNSIVMNRIRSIMCSPLIHDNRVIGLIYVDTQSLTKPFNKQHLEALTTLALLSAVAVQQAQLREKIQQEQSIRQRLERYSAPSVVDRIVSLSPGEIGMQMIAEDREASVLFLDIVKFTNLSESRSPHEVTQLLNSVFERLTDCVFEYEGTLDKFTGDGLMAIFGAPLAQEDHALRAARAAIRMQQRLVEFNQSSGHNLRIRIGINSGHVLAGDIGSPRRRDYTVIGDTVNVASRLESQVAQPDQIVVGSLTYDYIKDEIRCEHVGPVNVKGKQEKVQAYLVWWQDTRDSTHFGSTRPPPVK